jgi:hypothetical protein
MKLIGKERTPGLSAIKLYCLGEPSHRELLVSQILKSLQATFDAFPAEYDISGPYGIPKGSTIGIKAFQNRLAKKGHDKYFSLSGETNNLFGFRLLLGAQINETSYSELLVWYALGSRKIDFLKLVEPLLEPLDAVCGFEIDLPLDYSPSSETKIKKSFWGSISVEINNRHLAWVPTIRQGGMRGLFKNNIVNSEQLALLPVPDKATAKPLRHGLYYIQLSE